MILFANVANKTTWNNLFQVDLGGVSKSQSGPFLIFYLSNVKI